MKKRWFAAAFVSTAQRFSFSSRNVFLSFSFRNAPLQKEISIFGCKMGTIPGGNFHLDNLLAQEYFFTVLLLSPRRPVNPTT